MHITILTMGSRGDVQPFIALGIGLKQAGHQVRLATHATFKAMIRERGLDFAAIEGNPQAFVRSTAAQSMMQTRNPFEINRRFRDVLDPVLATAQLDSWKACQGTDVIIVGGIVFWGIDIAERLQAPCFYATLQPAAPTRAFPVSIVPPASERLGGLYNRFTYTLVNRLLWQLLQSSINQFRQSVLQLAPTQRPPFVRMRDRRISLISAVSPSVVPTPSDWTELDAMTGYWFLDQPDFVPPADLMDFLRSSPPPIYLGFGSMGGKTAEQVVAMTLAALQRTRQRGILSVQWEDIQQSALPDHIFKISSIPHDWLFPQMSCIVHHQYSAMKP
jgi:UDP:flavonoid glycosyltransferase YjiC (YdhE family)